MGKAFFFALSLVNLNRRLLMKKITDIPKYSYPESIDLKERKWPSRILTDSPKWCSVDLRDGNQALPDPLTPKQKLEYFHLLCEIGFKEIEIGFPSASEADFSFTRLLIEEDHIEDDVYIMTLVQARSDLIERTLKSLRNVKRAIVHLYCATSDLHIKQVFDKSYQETKQIIINSVKQIRDISGSMTDSDIRLEFSPEEFTDSNMEFVLEVCEDIYNVWGKAAPEKPIIINLPSTVERRPPNQYADMIEWFCNKFKRSKHIIISIHTHNDQGMAVAASELGLLAGAERVEGTLFGHGERTGNVDIVTVANNLFSRGIDINLDFSNLDRIVKKVETLTGMPVYYRQPYSGEYVFTAFSGSHQDAIRKGLYKINESGKKFGVKWKVPYLLVDPEDIGRKYTNIIRINSQSGKGGASWILEQEYGIKLSKSVQVKFGRAVQKFSDKNLREITKEEIYYIYKKYFKKFQKV